MDAIQDGDGLGVWLKSQPPEFACAIAARVALRAVPVLRQALGAAGEARRRAVVLPSLRALAVANFGGKWPGRAAEIRGFAREAGRRARESVGDEGNNARMGAFEARDAVPEMQEYVRELDSDVRSLEIAERAVDAVLHASQAVVDHVDGAQGIASPDAVMESCASAAIAAANAVDGVNGDTEFFDITEEKDGDEARVAAHVAEFWQAVEWDRRFLEKGTEGSRDPGTTVLGLCERALWPIAIPLWAGREWADLKDGLPDVEHWSVWTDWYEARLKGRPADEGAELDRATIKREDWEQGPGHVNAIVRNILGKRGRSTRGGRKERRTRQNQAKRYNSPDDPDSYVTPSRLKRLGREKQWAYMVQWFHGMFEDPANETPYDGREGGYQYIWGGPYEAADELGAEFGDIVSEEALEAAIAEVESDGIVEWAPGPGHPDQKARMEEAMADDREPPTTTLEEIRERLEGGFSPQFGDALEARRRASLRDEIAKLRDLMERDGRVHGGIGHNQPPEHLALSVELTVEVKQTIERIDSEVSKPAPSVEAVVEATGKLEKVLAWIGKRLEISVDAFLTKYWSTLGIAAALGTGVALSPIGERLGRIFNAALEWLDAVTLAF